jgi:hypothetical protein
VNVVLTITFWGAVITGVLAFVLLVIGVIHGLQKKDWNTTLIGAYTGVLAAVFGVFVWLIYDPSSAPSNLDLVYGLLSRINIGAEGWTSDAFDIILDYGEATWFLFRQALGTLPFVISMALVLYLQITAIFAIVLGARRGYPTLLLYSAPALAGVSSLLLGLFG